MKSTLYNFTPLIQSHPILLSLDSTHSPNSVMNHLPAHSIGFSSTHPIQIHPFHFDSSLPRSPRRMHNKHAKQSHRMKRHTHHYSLFKHQLQSSPPHPLMSVATHPIQSTNHFTPKKGEHISIHSQRTHSHQSHYHPPNADPSKTQSSFITLPSSCLRRAVGGHDSCLPRLLLLSNHPFNASKRSINIS